VNSEQLSVISEQLSVNSEYLLEGEEGRWGDKGTRGNLKREHPYFVKIEFGSASILLA
jgi:hypothetical protein